MGKLVLVRAPKTAFSMINTSPGYIPPEGVSIGTIACEVSLARGRYFARGRGRGVWPNMPEGKAWNEARHGLPVRFFGPGRRDVLIRRAQGRDSGPK